jgi:hypothetical protein
MPTPALATIMVLRITRSVEGTARKALGSLENHLQDPWGAYFRHEVIPLRKEAF